MARAAHGRKTTIYDIAVAAHASPATVSLAQTRKPARIVVLSRSPLPEVSAFRDGMRELGWVEGRTYILEERYAGGVAARLHELASTVPESRTAIASNLSTYPALLEWLGSLGQPDVDAALQRRGQ